MWRVSEGRVKAVQMPVGRTKVALEHLALVATRHTTLDAQNRLVVVVERFCVVGPLISIATVFSPVSCY